MLTGKEIIRRKGIGDIIIDPFDEKRINPNSYNLTLNKKLLIYDNISSEELPFKLQLNNVNRETLSGTIGEIYDKVMPKTILDMKLENKTKEIIIPDEGLILLPGKLYLGQTNEYTETHNLVPAISGRSSIGRLGINIHATAGFGDIGFKGNWTLEIFVVEPIVIYPDVELCQIYYYNPDGKYDSYNGRYQNNNGVEASKLFQDYK